MALRAALTLGAALAALSCSVEEGKPGDSCVRTSQCQFLLACVEGVCSDDLSSVAEQSTVPELVQDADEADADAMMDGGMPDAAAAPVADAAAP